MNRMQLIVGVVTCAFPLAAAAQSKLTLKDVKQQGGMQVSADEAKTLLPGAKVTSLANNGATRRWDNAADGKFVATTDNANDIGSNRHRTVQGNWHIGDNGAFCVELAWSAGPEKWCRFLFRLGDKYYGFNSLTNASGIAYEYAFSK